MNWLLLILTLPTENATARMRAWRALKAAGAAVLRDGVYLLPERDSCRTQLQAVAADVQASGGSVHLLSATAVGGDDFSTLFNRQPAYAELLADVAGLRAALPAENATGMLKPVRKLRKAFLAIAETDFFPDEAQRQAEAALRELEALVERALSPDEPHAAEGGIALRNCADYRGRCWATRQRPWVDRLASAWLIRRFIDPEAHLLWLASPADCPAGALGFDFDGAEFSHVGGKVTFEVLLASFALDTPALRRLGALVHFLDAGGIEPPEAGGVELVLAGLRETLSDDDTLLQAACGVFDGIHAAFAKETLP